MLSAAQVLSRQQVSKAESATRVGVVILHWGGPDKPEHIDAFLQNVYEDPSMVRLPGGQWFRPYFSRAAWTLQRKGIRKQYDSVGGYSPAIGLALEQARGLENLLKHNAQKHHDVTFKVYTSMQFSHPSAAETARRLIRDGVTQVVLVPGFLQPFKAGSQNVLERWHGHVHSGHTATWSTCEVGSYATNPQVLRAISERIHQALQRFPRYNRKRVTVLFAATGVPSRHETAYYQEVQNTADIVMGLRGQTAPADVAYYGYFGPINGPGPELKRKIESLGRQGVRNVLVVPVGGITDTLHTAHYLGMACRTTAMRAGIAQYEVAQALNSHRLFLDALADLVLKRVDVSRQAAGGVA